MSRYVPVEGFSGLVRDTQSNALINTNAEEIAQAREAKRLRREQVAKQKLVEERLSDLESDVRDIKEGIQLLLSKTYK